MQNQQKQSKINQNVLKTFEYLNSRLMFVS